MLSGSKAELRPSTQSPVPGSDETVIPEYPNFGGLNLEAGAP